MRFIHEPLARMIGATPSHVLTLTNWLIDWLIDWFPTQNEQPTGAGKLLTYLSRKPTLTLTSHLRQIIGLGEG